MREEEVDHHETITSFIFFLLFHFGLIIISVVAWYCIWLKRFGYDIYHPKGSSDRNTQFIGRIESMQEVERQKNFIKYWRFVLSKTWSLNGDFWRGISPDAYLYLVLLKYLGRLSIIIFLFTFIFNIFNHWSELFKSIREESLARVFFDIFFGSRLDLSSNASAYLQTTLCFIVTMCTVLTVLKLRANLKSLFKRVMSYERRTIRSILSDYSTDWLNSHTLYIRGLLQSDKHGKLCEQIINDKIEEFGGKLLKVEYDFHKSRSYNGSEPELTGVHVVDSNRKITKYIDRRETLNEKIELNGWKEPFCRRCKPRRKREPEYLKRKRDKLDQKLSKMMKKNFKSSCHAYVVFDSYSSMMRCLENFKDSTMFHCKSIWLDCKNLCKKKPDERILRSISFIEEESQLMTKEYKRNGICLIASLPTDPVNVIWFNRGGKRGFYFLRKYLWNILGIILILFVSTPAVFFHTLKNIAEENLNFRLLEYLPFVEHYSQYIPTLIILLINLILLVLIDKVALMERHSFHHNYQKSVYNKAAIYLHLNMVLFPFLSLQEIPIYKLLVAGESTKVQFKDFTMLDSTPFFGKLITQLSIFGSIFYLLRLGDLINGYLSPYYCTYIRDKFNSDQGWRRNPEAVFQYGYFYSQIVTAFTIIVLFSSTAPVIALLGSMFYYLKLLVDSHLLISVHKKEMDSSVYLYKRVITMLIVSLLFYQCVIILFFYFNDQFIATFIVGIILFLTFICICNISSENLVHYVLRECQQRELEVLPNENSPIFRHSAQVSRRTDLVRTPQLERSMRLTPANRERGGLENEFSEGDFGPNAELWQKWGERLKNPAFQFLPHFEEEKTEVNIC
ncbi:unnamed protein product [Moneuplotes crassus]|uniref:CSC1/OSCA1-like 7TM region domain-containing protein n=1 Tax=Euplotes crassus TaxID=5936 RepID=A0AAD2D7B2_EUPCR|nr:unnamed protein product [Moneuplotes crassus]